MPEKPDYQKSPPKTSMAERLKETLGIVNSMQETTETEYVDVSELQSELEEHFPMERRIEEKFEIQTIPSNIKNSDSEISDVKTDYLYSRNVHYTLNNVLGDALQKAVGLAKDTEHPKTFEIVNELAKTMLEVSKSMMSIQKIYKDVSAESLQRAQTINNVQINNNGESTVFSTDDVLNLIDDTKKTKIIDKI